MPYEVKRDKELFSKELIIDDTKVIVSVHSYNNGPKKLQITREVKDKTQQFIFTRLGRLSKEEIEGILPIIQEALKIM